jgi:isocitrate/isopropylmalate dehydrogenase
MNAMISSLGRTASPIVVTPSWLITPHIWPGGMCASAALMLHWQTSRPGGPAADVDRIDRAVKEHLSLAKGARASDALSDQCVTATISAPQ